MCIKIGQFESEIQNFLQSLTFAKFQDRGAFTKLTKLKIGENMEIINENGIPDFTVRALIGFVNVFGGTGRQAERIDQLKRITNSATKVRSQPNSQSECETFRYKIFTQHFEFDFEVIEWLDNVQRKHITYKIYNPTEQILAFIEEKIGFDMPITKIDFVLEMATPEPEALFELIAPSIFLKWKYRVKEGFTFKTAIQTNTNMEPKVFLHAIARPSAFKYLKVVNLGDLPSVTPSHVGSYLSIRPYDSPRFKANVLRNAQSKQEAELYIDSMLNQIRDTGITKGVNQTQIYLEERNIFSSFVRHPINSRFQEAISDLRFMPPLVSK